MKLAWKMIAAVAVLLALSLSAGGIFVVGNAYRAEAEAAVAEAEEDMKLIGTTLQALCLMENDRESPEAAVQRVMRRNAVFSDYSYWIYDAQGRPLVGAGDAYPEEEIDQETGVIRTRLLQRGEHLYVCATQRLTLLGESFGLKRTRDATDVLDHAQRNLRQYELVMLAILLAGIGLTTLFTFWMTRPIRVLSRTAKQLSDGRYDRRAAVRSSDELGQLAREFNRMADALEEKINALEDAARRQKEFTASFAHELKTPLTSVIGYADTLRSRQLPRKQELEAAGYIFSEGKRLEAMSFALLDLFSLEREAPELQSVQVTQPIRELEQSTAYLLKENGMLLKTDVQPGEIRAAPELLKTLLYNLIDNARKASKPGDPIELTGRRAEGGYCFTVTDHGRGIPEAALNRLTEPFYMVEKSRARAQGGAGLGLTLCQRIVQAHGGSLSFESTEGQGTSVLVRIGGGEP